ncbi:MAG: ribose 5-phosphate isomerase B [Planctomycetaceae bacterium]|nr:ribose 5-phosphate isomerase B [Planctomycetaceae bacterium]
MKVAIGSDHHGIRFKHQAAELLRTLGVEVVDVGAHDAEVPCDYPDSAKEVGCLVSKGNADRGVLICGSGVGMAIAANKFPGVRAAVCDTVELARLTRQHNGLNVLCLSGNLWKQQDLLPVVQAFLETDFEGGRHQRRIEKIAEIETSVAASRSCR